MNAIKNIFMRMRKSEKIVFFGSLISLISLVLPWYRDLDAWGKGDVFLGVTGPLSMIGYIIAVMSGSVFLVILGRMLKKPVRVLENVVNLPLKVAMQQGLLIFITASIYFDQKFGVNVTLKETSIGLFLCIVGSLLMAYGCYVRDDANDSENAQDEEDPFGIISNRIERMHREIAAAEKSEEDLTLAEREYREAHKEEEEVVS